MKKSHLISVVCLALASIGMSVRAAGFDIQLFDVSQQTPSIAVFQGTGEDCRPVASMPGDEAVFLRDNQKCLVLENKTGVTDVSRIMTDYSWPIHDFIDAEIFVNVYIPVNPISDTISLWIEDANGETFRFDAPLKNTKLGWQKIRYVIHSNRKYDDAEKAGTAPDGLITLPAKLLGFGTAKIDSENGELDFSSIDMKLHTMPLAPVFQSGVGTPVNVLRPGEEKMLGFLLCNYSGQAAQVMMSWKLLDFNGRVLENFKRFIAVPENSDAFLNIKAPDCFGAYQLQMTFENLTLSTSSTRTFSFAYMKPFGPKPMATHKFTFGINTFPQGKDEYGFWREAVSASWCGAMNARVMASWEDFQPAEKTWNVEFADPACKAFKAQGLNTSLVLGYTPAWAVDAGISGISYPVNDPGLHRRMPDIELWQIFIKKIVQFYQRKINGIEIWNGQDLYMNADFSAENYVSLLNEAYEIIKRMNSKLQVKTGGFVCQPKAYGLRYHAGVLENVVANGSFDILSLQGRGAASDLESQLDMLKQNGNSKPVQVVAASVSSANGNYDRQAADLFRKGILSMAGGATVFFWNSLCDTGNDLTVASQNQGMLTKDMFPKPAYVAYNTLVSLFNNSSFVEKSEYNDGLIGYTFKTSRNELQTAVWNTSDACLQSVMLAKNVTGKPEAFDIYGNALNPEVCFGIAAFTVKNAPVVFKGKFADNKADISGPVLSQINEFKVVPGNESVWKIQITNPMPEKTLEFSLTLELPDGITQTNAFPENIIIAPGRSRTIEITVAVADGFVSNFDNPCSAIVQLTSQQNIDCKLDCTVVTW